MKLLIYKIIKNLFFFRLLFFSLISLKLIFHKKNYKIFFSKKKILIALDYVRFGSDLEILEHKSNFIFFRVPYYFIRQIFNPIIVTKKNQMKKFDIFTLERSIKNGNIKKLFFEKYQNIFNFFLHIIRAKAVVSAAVHYKFDVVFGELSKKAGLKYIIFHKENFSPLELQIKKKIQFYKNYTKSNADLIITHNVTTKNILKKTASYKTKIIALGSLRFSEYFFKLKKNRKKSNNELITLFSFTHRNGIYGEFNEPFQKDKGWIKLFKNVHESFYQLALERPDIKFVVKTKWIFEWHDEILKVFGLNSKSELPNNLIISSSHNVKDLIENSNSIIAFNSSTILESALYGHKVICPNFDEAKQKYKQFVIHNIFKHGIIKADSKEILKKKILKSLDKNNNRNNFKPLLVKSFIKYLTPINTNVKKDYSNQINRILNV